MSTPGSFSAQSVRRRWTWYPEIHSGPLSDDVLHLIFELLAQERVIYRTRGIIAIDVVPLVCRRWRRIALGRSRFWRTLLFHDRTTHSDVGTKLALADKQQLHIEIVRLEPLGWNGIQHYVSFAETLAMQAERIKTFKIIGFDAMQMSTILQIFTSGAPELEEVLVAFSESTRPSPSAPLLLFGGLMPKLQHATIMGRAVSFIGFDHLRSLRLTNQTRLRFQAFMSVLEHNPTLETVVVRKERYSNWDARRPYPRIVPLPRLQALTLQGHQDDVLHMLSPLDFPQTTHVAITLFDHRDPDNDVPQDFRSLRAITRRLRALELIYMTQGENLVVGLASSDAPVSVCWIWLQADDDCFNGQLGLMFELVDVPNVTTLKIFALPSGAAVHRLEWRRFLNLVPALQRLDIRVPASSRLHEPSPLDESLVLGHFSSLCEELATPALRHTADGQSALHCQDLRLLSLPYDWIRSDRAMAEFTSCARTRVESGGSELSLAE